METAAVGMLCDELLHAIQDEAGPSVGDRPPHGPPGGLPTGTLARPMGAPQRLWSEGHQDQATPLGASRANGAAGRLVPGSDRHRQEASGMTPIADTRHEAPDIASNAGESPMDTTSVYLARRFCTNCCREWGDMELLLDLRARRTGRTRGEVMLELAGMSGSPEGSMLSYGLCCRKALFSVQHNIDSYTAHAASAISSDLGEGVPTCLALTVARPRPRISWITRTEGPLPLRGPITEEAVNAMFSH
jgi:hypothetical protein